MVDQLLASYTSSIIFDQYGMVQPGPNGTSVLDQYLTFPPMRIEDLGTKVLLGSMIDTRTKKSVWSTADVLRRSFPERLRPCVCESIMERQHLALTPERREPWLDKLL